ncbi:uncharacterized protein N7506_008664 [Penicillium brevicompactum]|uniref:uncharacterized protein n=1 Tax=Penicillium brevicompactum TaxID=5074 RepID=UPI0025425098|nr:uncharacterized protein N7506_008664 [Penicillium brevicompactum]KAJ5325562.1 hypothetical protein N7506_008664 [Penicillium brevicompactum]
MRLATGHAQGWVCYADVNGSWRRSSIQEREKHMASKEALHQTACVRLVDEKEIQKREEIRARAARERGATLLSPYTTPGPMSYGRSE